MGALTPPIHWIPEDDLLLKNSIEAGASLESLAKGAVHFSRRFTIQELQDRWYSLLYDPIISAEASNCMIEFEHSGSTLLSKPNRLDGTKETRCISGKRKSESIRKCYYSMRKRISNEPFNMMDVNFLRGRGRMYCKNGNEPPSDCMIENLGPDHFEIHDPDFVMVNPSFPDLATCAADSTVHDVAPFIDNHVEHLPFGGKDVSQSSCPTYEKDISLPGDHSPALVFGQSNILPGGSLFEDGSLEVDDPAVFGNINNCEGNVTSEFEGTSFHNFEFSSTSTQMPIWSTVEGIPEPTMPFQFREKDLQIGGTFIFPHSGDANSMDTLGYDHDLNSDLKNPVPPEDMKILTPGEEDYFEQLSNTLFDFTNEEPLLMDTDENNTIEKSYLDGLRSLLLDSPNRSELPDVSKSTALGSPGVQFTVSTSTCLADLGEKGLMHCNDQRGFPKARVAPDVSNVKAFGPEYRNGVIHCTLNCEDTEVPSNDDVFLPFRFPSPPNSSGADWKIHKAYYPTASFIKDFPSTQKAIGGSSLKNNRKDSHILAPILGLPKQKDMGAKQRDRGIKFELPDSNIQHLSLRNAKNSEGPSGSRSVNANTMEQEKNLDHEPGPSSPCPNKHTRSPDDIQSFQKIAIGSNKEVDAAISIPKIGESNTDLSSMTMIVQEQIEKPSVSDQEEFSSEDDFDIPYFSDVEAMILDMDLSPDNFDLRSNQKVLRYQHEEIKRTIIRLEQAAEAYMQKAMAAQGAFSVLIGHRSRHLIMKPQVLLGRSTEDVKVDIDLGREGRANKISRRQAIIELDSHGVFHLKNLGKISIHVNGKKLAPQQSVNLTSGCLIEVKQLAYVFETSQIRIKQHVHDIVGGSLC